jgi:hypothetical protein
MRHILSHMFECETTLTGELFLFSGSFRNLFPAFLQNTAVDAAPQRLISQNYTTIKIGPKAFDRCNLVSADPEQRMQSKKKKSITRIPLKKV